jgi:coenzyme PQQ synthesis protein D (PqqD)
MTIHRYELNVPAVIGEIVDGEVMVMNLRDGIYYSVAGAGAAVWPALTGRCAVDDIAIAIAAASGAPLATVEGDLARFVKRLVAEAILRPAGDDSPAEAPQLVDFGSYRDFVIERFDDMRAMLILDPVHEVGEFGWPQQSEPKPR